VYSSPTTLLERFGSIPCIQSQTLSAGSNHYEVLPADDRSPLCAGTILQKAGRVGKGYGSPGATMIAPALAESVLPPRKIAWRKRQPSACSAWAIRAPKSFFLFSIVRSAASRSKNRSFSIPKFALRKCSIRCPAQVESDSLDTVAVTGRDRRAGPPGILGSRKNSTRASPWTREVKR
jgi:hypothetical protein